MQVQNDRHSWNVRALLESTATPFAIADYGPRAAIFLQGDPCDRVMHTERGRIWLAVTARSGKEAICGLLDTGAFLGEEALTGCGERRQSAIAMTPTQVLVVAKAHMIRLLYTQPGLMDRFIAHLLARNTRLEANLTTRRIDGNCCAARYRAVTPLAAIMKSSMICLARFVVSAARSRSWSPSNSGFA